MNYSMQNAAHVVLIIYWKVFSEQHCNNAVSMYIPRPFYVTFHVCTMAHGMVTNTVLTQRMK